MPKSEITDAHLDLLAELGVDLTPEPTRELSRGEERVLAGFEDILRWVEREGRAPEHGEGRGVFEQMYAVRLDRIRGLTEYRELLLPYDAPGLLGAPSATLQAADVPDDGLLAALGVAPAESELTELRHVRSAEERRAAAEEIAQRTVCEDFDAFAAIFERAKLGLQTGAYATTKYKEDASIAPGDLFIVDGQTALVAGEGPEFKQEHGRLDRRLRVIYDNGTESEPLRRSLQRALNKDATSRRLRPNDDGPLFAAAAEDGDAVAGHLYVLASRSEQPWLRERRDLVHKIGVTTGSVEARVAGAAKDPTYLLADVEIVRSYQLIGVVPHKLEALVQRFFASTNLDLELRDRFDVAVHPREWFLLPLSAVDEAMARILDGTLGRYRFDVERMMVVER